MDIMTTHEAKARELFLEGYNCAQSTFAAFCDVTGMSFETAVKLASGFGAGMGGLRDTCGAVTGMFMAADMLWGYDSPKDAAGKKTHYELIRRLAEEFKEENGTLVCRELLEGCKKELNPMERTREYYTERPCTRLVQCAARILDELIMEKTV